MTDDQRILAGEGDIEVWREPTGAICLKSLNPFDDPTDLGEEAIVELAEILLRLATRPGEGDVGLGAQTKAKATIGATGQSLWTYEAADGRVDVWLDSAICLKIRKPLGVHIELSNAEALAVAGMLMRAAEVSRG
ncbi:hypothetical protein [Oleomonas cavernae]|nr:hypothetical protein [Oleomonas cavernae]